MRLVMVIHRLGSGGAQRAITTLANHWAARGHSIVLITHEADKAEPFYPLDPRVDYRPLGLSLRSRNIFVRAWFSGGKAWRIRRALLAAGPQAVISFTYPVNVLCLLATLGTGIPVVVSERVDPGSGLGIKRVWKALRYWLYPGARCLVVQTERIARRFRPRLDGRLAVIPNPVLPPPEGGSDESVSAGDRTVVSFGRLDPQKGFDLLVRAFAGIIAGHPGWDLAIFGEGEERAPLLLLARELGVEDKVRFPGHVKNAYAVMKRAGLFVLSSRYEGFPNALCEAMASGMPVIAADCPTGPREIVTDGVDGLLVPAEDAGALARAMDRLMGDDVLRRDLGRRAAAITERFAIDAVMAQWERVLRERCGVRP